MNLHELIEASLVTKPYAVKQLPNGTVRWYKLPNSSYSIIFTKWFDNCIHLEYRDMRDVKNYHVIYSDLPYEKNNAMFDRPEKIIISDRVPVFQKVCTSS